MPRHGLEVTPAHFGTVLAAALAVAAITAPALGDVFVFRVGGTVEAHQSSFQLRADREQSSIGARLASMPRPVELDPVVSAAAQRHGLDAELVWSVMAAESAFNPQAVSHAGAQGLMQLMPATAERFGVSDPFDPEQNIEAGTRYLAWLLDRFDGNRSLALAGYNAGEGNVDRYGGIPPFAETRNYVARISEMLGDPAPRAVRATAQAASQLVYSIGPDPSGEEDDADAPGFFFVD